MGLDMYLYRKTYVKNWDYMKPEERHTVTVTGPHAAGIEPEWVCEVVEQVGYWRKANAIHNWFVQNVQDGKDECQESDVSREQLQELLDTVEKVLASSKTADGNVHVGTEYSGGKRTELYEPGKIIVNPEVAHELLPTSSGFFFGGTDYDGYYLEDLQYTRDLLKELLNGPHDTWHTSYAYRASW